MRAGRPLGHDRARSGDRAERHARRQPLGQHQDIGNNPGMLQCEELAGPAETGLDLIEDQHDAVFIADRAQPLQEAGRRDDVAAFSEDRFNHDRGGFLRRRLGLQQVAQLIDGIAAAMAPVRWTGCAQGSPIRDGHGPLRDRAVETVGVRRSEDPGRQRLIARAITGLAHRHRHRHVGASMKRALKRDDIRAAGRLFGQLHRGFDRLGPAVGEEIGVNLRRQDLAQLIGQLEHRLAGDDTNLPVDHLGRLVLDRLDHARVGVTGIRHANAAGEVHVALALSIVDVDPFGIVDVDIEGARPDRGEILFAHDELLGTVVGDADQAPVDLARVTLPTPASAFSYSDKTNKSEDSRLR